VSRRLVVLVVALAAGGVACAPRGRAAVLAGSATDTTFYVSARARAFGRDTRLLADSLEYGLIVTVRSRPEDPLTDNALAFDLVDSLRMSRGEFVAALQRRAAASDFAVFYTHGFGTSLHEGWEHAVYGRIRSRGDQPWVVFNWPAADGWLTWPKRGSILAASYRRDSANATASRPAFLRAFAAVQEAVGSERMLLFTHSLGVQVAAEALASDSAPLTALQERPLLGMAFHAPDVESRRFTEVLVPAARRLTRRIVLYASSDDRALGLAQRVSNTTRAGRIGRAGGLPVQHPLLESIDVTTGASAEGFLHRLFGARHGVRHGTATFFDLVHVVGGGRAVECREAIGSAVRTTATTWRLVGSLPAPSAARGCAPYQRADTTDRGPFADGSTSAARSAAPVSSAPRAVTR
jgi:esterase/lipase superfamily enzyme